MLAAGTISAFVLFVILRAVDYLMVDRSVFLVVATGPLCFLGSVRCDPDGIPSLLIFFILFAIVWPIVFGLGHQSIPGDDITRRSMTFGVVLWGLSVVVVVISLSLGIAISNLPFVVVTLMMYLIYGFSLGRSLEMLGGSTNREPQPADVTH